MKRSSSITLTLFATATLAACGEEAPPPAPKPFASVQECIVGGNTEDVCKDAFEKAFETHKTTAPRFTAQEDCEKGVDVDKCVKTQVKNSDGSFSDVFLPAMAGYLLGQAMNRPPDPQREETRGYTGGYVGGRGYTTGPVYNSRTYPGGYRDSYNMRSTIPRVGTAARPSPPSVGASFPRSTTSVGGYAPSRPSVGLPSRPSNIGTTTISRGGFGGGSRSFSMGG